MYGVYGIDNDCVWTNTDGKVLNLTEISKEMTIGWNPNKSQYFMLTPCSNGITCTESTGYYMAIKSGGQFPQNDCEAYLAKETASDKPVEWSNTNGGTFTFVYNGNYVQPHPACTDGVNTTVIYQCNSADGDKLTPLTIEDGSQCAVTLVENTSLACIY